MKKNVLILFMLCGVEMGAGRRAFGLDYLKSWSPASGTSSFGPYTGYTGDMNMWQDGTCYSGKALASQVTETWACKPPAEATVDGSAGLTYQNDGCQSLPVGVWSVGSRREPTRHSSE